MKIKTYVELQVEVDVDYSPARPAPVCYNHDDPKFSDPGDDEFLEYHQISFIVDGKKVPVFSCMAEHIVAKIDGDVIDQCRDKLSHDREE